MTDEKTIWSKLEEALLVKIAEAAFSTPGMKIQDHYNVELENLNGRTGSSFKERSASSISNKLSALKLLKEDDGTTPLYPWLEPFKANNDCQQWIDLAAAKKEEDEQRIFLRMLERLSPDKLAALVVKAQGAPAPVVAPSPTPVVEPAVEPPKPDIDTLEPLIDPEYRTEEALCDLLGCPRGLLYAWKDYEEKMPGKGVRAMKFSGTTYFSKVDALLHIQVQPQVAKVHLRTPAPIPQGRPATKLPDFPPPPQPSPLSVPNPSTRAYLARRQEELAQVFPDSVVPDPARGLAAMGGVSCGAIEGEFIRKGYILSDKTAIRPDGSVQTSIVVHVIPTKGGPKAKDNPALFVHQFSSLTPRQQGIVSAFLSQQKAFNLMMSKELNYPEEKE